MEKNVIITIGRQYGSGGKNIGQILAKKLCINFYDKELINLASKASGIANEFFEKADEQANSSLWSSMSMGFAVSGLVIQPTDYLSNESLFQIQSDVIRKIALAESCVIVGRCADYILRDKENCIKVFIYADLGDRVRKIMDTNKISEKDALHLIKKIDKSRSAYYNYYSDKEWGKSESYDICINSSLLGEEKTADLIADIVKFKQNPI